MATENDTTPAAWNVETLKQFFSTSLNDFKENTLQRFSAMENIHRADAAASDLRYQQRFDAGERALGAASLAAEKAVQAALAAAEKAVLAASVSSEKSGAAGLAAAEKAIEKAETAQRAHNTSQNEWRSTVNDLTKTVADNARHELESAVSALRNNTDIALRAMGDKVSSSETRLDKADGRQAGGVASQSTTFAIAGVVAAFVGIAVSLLSHFGGSPPAVVPIPAAVAVVPVGPK